MLYLSATASKEVILTLKETSYTLLTDYYVWKLYNKDSHTEYVFSADNWSTSPYYQGFTVSVGTPSNPTGSNVKIDAPQGSYGYIIYQSSTQYDLSLVNNLGMVELGLLTILGTSSTNIVATASDVNTIKIYQNI